MVMCRHVIIYTLYRYAQFKHAMFLSNVHNILYNHLIFAGSCQIPQVQSDRNYDQTYHSDESSGTGAGIRRRCGRLSHHLACPGRVFFFGVHAWLVKVLGPFSIIYLRGLGLTIGVKVWVRVRVGVRVWVRVRVRVSLVLWSG